LYGVGSSEGAGSCQDKARALRCEIVAAAAAEVARKRRRVVRFDIRNKLQGATGRSIAFDARNFWRILILGRREPSVLEGGGYSTRTRYFARNLLAGRFQMRDDLMAEEIEIDLLRRASPFRTTWKVPIKIPGSARIASRKRQYGRR
jgi:hypothetical protein